MSQPVGTPGQATRPVCPFYPFEGMVETGEDISKLGIRGNL